MKSSTILVINVVINLRYRGQKDEGKVQFVTTGASSTNNTSRDGSSVKKSSPAATTETLEVEQPRESRSGSEPKENKGEQLIETATKKGEISEKTADEEFRVLEIPAVVCSSKLPDRVLLTDVVVRKIRDCLWSSQSDPPVILTPSEIIFIKKKGDMFEDVIEKLRSESKIGVSAQLETRGGIRKGTLSLLSIATTTTVFIFDILEIGQEVFRWGLGLVLTNPHCVKITHDSRLLREAFDFDNF